MAPCREGVPRWPDGRPDVHCRRTASTTAPTSCEPAPGRIWVQDEMSLRLLGRCGPHHPAVIWLHDATHQTDPDLAEDWLAKHEVWSAVLHEVGR